jgi:omega-6 fatty acid desaturase (delta-12 desaturase)
MTHNIMQHTAHHLHPRIPLYQLPKAEKALAEALGERFISDRFTIPWFLRTMGDCKLYDYEQHQWLDFKGNASSKVHLGASPLSRQAIGESVNA